MIEDLSRVDFGAVRARAVELQRRDPSIADGAAWQRATDDLEAGRLGAPDAVITQIARTRPESLFKGAGYFEVSA